jgi:hypothetical protein
LTQSGGDGRITKFEVRESFPAIAGGVTICQPARMNARTRDRLIGISLLTARRGLHAFCGLILLLTAGCAGFRPGDEAVRAALRQRAVTRSDELFKVETAVPTADETKALFDRRLDRNGIQPVWLRIENRSDQPARFRPHAVDTEYFAPMEVAYQYHSAWRPGRNLAMSSCFLSNAMPATIPPHSVRSGFVFSHHDLGNKQVNVELLPEFDSARARRYYFYVDVPGLQRGWEPHTWDELAHGMQFIDCDEGRLQAELARYPRATTDKHGVKEGDPLNLVIIGSPEDLQALASCGWTQTGRMTRQSMWHTLKAFVFGGRYRYSPVSSHYVARRHQYLALQKVRHSINLRNHLRLWLTPLRYEGKPVWIGQISRDIGVRWTLKTPNLTTHKINPNVDETRSYLIQDLATGHVAKWWAFVPGTEAVPMEQPRRNLTGDPYFTDGLRAVIEISAEPVADGRVEFKRWTLPPDYQ